MAYYKTGKPTRGTVQILHDMTKDDNYAALSEQQKTDRYEDTSTRQKLAQQQQTDDDNIPLIYGSQSFR